MITSKELQAAFPKLDAKELRSIVARTRNFDDDQIDEILDHVNKVTNSHGVEAVQINEYVSSYYINIGLLYVNTGDTYEQTLAYDTREGEFIVTSWGGWFEEYEQEEGSEEE